MLANVLCVLALISCGTDENPTVQLTIEGTITENGMGVAGITVVTDGGASTTTSADGKYTFSAVAAGTHVVKPQQAGRNFSPSELSVTLINQNMTGIDFTRSPDNLLVHRSNTWELFNPITYAVKQNTPTALQLDLAQNALWFNSSKGGLVYRTMTGDFTITATVNAVSKSNNNQGASCNVCLGGLMVRNASGASENYVHLVTGNTPNGLGYEYKSTTNNVSVYTAVADGNTRRDLRIQRSGHDVILSQKLPSSSTWQVITTYTRHDFPSAMMVGMNIYTAASVAVADLSLVYEGVTVE